MKLLNTLVALVFLSVPFAVAEGKHQERIRQGEAALEKLPPATEPASVVLTEKKSGGEGRAARKLGAFRRNGGEYVLVPIAVDDAPGKYELVARSDDGEVLYRKSLYVKRTRFPVSKKKWYAAKHSEEERDRMKREKGEIARACENGARDPLWSDGFSLPIARKGKVGSVNSPFGHIRIYPEEKIKKKHHLGVDIKAPEGYPIKAIAAGRVAHVGRNYIGDGNITIIDHGAGVYSLYLHQSEIGVEAGESVAKGQVIGKVGETGSAEGPHLHLFVKVNGVFVDPLKLIALLKNAASN